MKIAVRLFAAARETAGREVVEVSVPAPANIAALRAGLAEQHPRLATWAAHSLFAIDAEYAPDTASIPEGADVACIPPVSGG
jgi:molybdopterin converting factor small subunit